MPRRTSKAHRRKYMRLYQADRQHARMAWAREQHGGKCAVCGATGYLEFHKTEASTRQGPLAALTTRNGAIFENEVLASILLCKSHGEYRKLELKRRKRPAESPDVVREEA